MGSSNNSEKKYIVRWQLVGYDLLMFIGVCAFVGYIYGPMTRASYLMSTLYTALAFVSVLIFRFWLKCYQIIIRYGGVGVYLRLILADCLGIMCYVPLKFALHLPLNSQRWQLFLLLNLLGTLTVRLVYRDDVRDGTN